MKLSKGFLEMQFRYKKLKLTKGAFLWGDPSSDQWSKICLDHSASKEPASAFLWDDPSSDQWSKICLGHGASKEPANPLWYRQVRSFGMIRVRISDPRSVCVMVHQRNRRIHSGHGFAGSFDAPWSRHILDHWSELGSSQRNALTGSFDAPWSRQILDHWSELGSPQRNAP